MSTSTVMLIYEIVDYKYDRDTIPCAVGTTEYSIANEQVTMQAIFQFFSLPLSVGGNL